MQLSGQSGELRYCPKLIQNKSPCGQSWAKERNIVRTQKPGGCWEERQLRVTDEVLVQSFPGEGDISQKFWNLLVEACGSTCAILPAVSLAYI